MKPREKKAVAAITFNDNRSLSMDVESVVRLEAGQPMDLGDGEHWFVELLIRTDHGTIAIQLLSNDKQNLRVRTLDAAD